MPNPTAPSAPQLPSEEFFGWIAQLREAANALGGVPSALWADRIDGLCFAAERLRGSLAPGAFFQRASKAARDLLERLSHALKVPSRTPTDEEQVGSSCDELAASLVPIATWDIAFSHEGRLDVLVERTNKAEKRVFDIAKAADEKVAEVAAAADTAVAKVREAAEKLGFAIHAAGFRRSASRSRRDAGVWLAVLVVTVLLVVLLAERVLGEYPGPDRAIAFFATRFVVLAGLGVLLALAGRNYRAHRHNVVVNEHRALALETFQLFDEGTKGDAEARSAILLKAAACVFQPQVSGYLTKEPDPLPHNTLVEVLRSGIGRGGTA